MKLSLILLIALLAHGAQAQSWHLNTEPVYFFLKSPNIALDYTLNSSVAVGVQYAAIDWAAGGRNLSGIQVFYSRTGEINTSSEVLKLYVGRLSPSTTLLEIESKASPIPLFEILYGYRWVSDSKFTIAVLAGTFFTSSKIYPGVSVPVGYLF